MMPTEFWIKFDIPYGDHKGRSQLSLILLSQMKFACELPFEDLPKHVNSAFDAVRAVVSERLKGKTQQGEPTVDIRYFPFTKETKFLCKF